MHIAKASIAGLLVFDLLDFNHASTLKSPRIQDIHCLGNQQLGLDKV